MVYRILIFIILLLLGCSYYYLPQQNPTFEDLLIDSERYNTIDKIVIYVETSIFQTSHDECTKFPWQTMQDCSGDIYDKAGLYAWMVKEAGLVSYPFIVCGGIRYSERTWYVIDELGNPLYNYKDEYGEHTYQHTGLDEFLYSATMNNCFTE